MPQSPVGRRRALAITLGAAAASALPAPANAADHPARPRQITGHADSLHPEGIAWDPTRRAFLVTSPRHGTVSLVGFDGRVTPLVDDPDPVIVSTVGVAVDAPRSRLLVAYHDLGVGTRSTPGTFLKVSGLAVYDLVSGRQIRLVDLTLGASPIHAADRVAVDPCGNAYVCDPAAGNIYKVTPDGCATILVSSELLAPGSEGAGVTGIALHPGGFLLANHYTEGRLLKIPLHDPAAISAVPLDSPIIGSDGIALRQNGSLLAVCNHLAVAAGQEVCAEVRPANAHWTGRASVRRTAWPVPVPTDIALTPYGGYVVSGRADVLFGGGLANDFVLQRL